MEDRYGRGEAAVSEVLRKKSKTCITDANPRFLAIIGLLQPGAEAAGTTTIKLVNYFTGGIWPDGHLVLDDSTLAFEGNRYTAWFVGRSIAFKIPLSTITEIRAGARFLASRIVTIKTTDGEVKINPIWGGIDTDDFLDALRQRVVNAGGHA